ncbi:MAG: DoxX family protein [Bacteroidota bacterium]
MNLPWHFFMMAIMYVVAGIFHFVKPKMYMRIMPRYLPQHKKLVYLSGLAEITLGLAVFVAPLRKFAIVGIVLMLSIFLLVHFYMLKGEKEAAGLPRWLLILRIPLQFFLVYWAIFYWNL